MEIRKKMPPVKVNASIQDIISPIARRYMMRLQMKDPNTLWHCLRVGELSRRFSQLLGNSENITAIIYQASLVHDIGKLAISEDTLKHPGKLNDDQWKEMQTHCEAGARIIDHIYRKKKRIIVSDIYHSEMRNGILYHHERWDGKGYPAGFSGEMIPYVARVIAICDSVDAMLNDRVYRKALSVQECRKEIIDNSGIMYDPRLSHEFIDNWEVILKGVYKK